MQPWSLLLLVYTCIAQITFQENGVAGLYGVVTAQWLPITLYFHTHNYHISSNRCIQISLRLGWRDNVILNLT